MPLRLQNSCSPAPALLLPAIAHSLSISFVWKWQKSTEMRIQWTILNIPSLSLLTLVYYATCCSRIVSSSSLLFHGCSLYPNLPMVWYVVTCLTDYRHARPTCTCASWICPPPPPCPDINHTLFYSASFAHDFRYMYNHYPLILTQDQHDGILLGTIRNLLSHSIGFFVISLIVFLLSFG